MCGVEYGWTWDGVIKAEGKLLSLYISALGHLRQGIVSIQCRGGSMDIVGVVYWVHPYIRLRTMIIL